MSSTLNPVASGEWATSGVQNVRLDVDVGFGRFHVC